jgi:hypothetical protein
MEFFKITAEFAGREQQINAGREQQINAPEQQTA